MGESNFIDYVKICCQSGNGGAGSHHFHRSKINPKGGPDGGDGGKGGDVVLVGNAQLWTLLHLKYRKHIKAGHGAAGGQSHSTGKSGESMVLEVPLGTVAKDAETMEVLFEITDDGEQKILIPGGRGGLGNSHFATSTNQSPQYAQPGEKGSERWIVLELKVLADVGLVGFPNAGKSTLLSVVSAAKPEIADYPFTTLVPNLGVVKYRDYRSFIIADIPGIIEGAAEGKGLGHYFLRHIERNSILLFLIPADVLDVKKAFDILHNELVRYNPELIDKDFVVVLSKCDLLDDELKAAYQEELKKTFDKIPHYMISSVAQTGLQELKDGLWKMLNRS